MWVGVDGCVDVCVFLCAGLRGRVYVCVYVFVWICGCGGWMREKRKCVCGSSVCGCV